MFRSPKPLLLERLKARGLEVAHQTDYEGPPGARREVQKEGIKWVGFPLSPAEWCSLCMRDGADYMGGCCGQMGYAQDTLNSIFRDSGGADDGTALEYVLQVEGHEGFEVLQEEDETKLLVEEAKWDQLRPIEKLMLCLAAVVPYMTLSWLQMPRRDKRVDPNSPKHVIDRVYRSFTYLHFKDWVSAKSDKWNDDDEPEEPPQVISGQAHGTTALRVARAVPAARRFLELAEEIIGEAFEGYAVVNSNDEILSNGWGDTLYYTREDAERIIELWKKSDDEIKNEKLKNGELDTYRIRPVRVSVSAGLEFKDEQ